MTHSEEAVMVKELLENRALLLDLAAHSKPDRTWLASFRGFHCLDLRRLAQKTGCSHETLRNLEKGKRTRDHLVLLRIAEVLSVPFNLLFKDDEYKPASGTRYYCTLRMDEEIPEVFQSNLEVVRQIIKKDETGGRDRVKDATGGRDRVRVFGDFPVRAPGARNRNVRSLLFRIFGVTEDLNFSISEEEMYENLKIIMRETEMSSIEMELIDAFWIQRRTQKEIKEQTGLSVPTIWRKLTRAYRKLRHPSCSRAIYYVLQNWDVERALKRASRWRTDVNWRIGDNCLPSPYKEFTPELASYELSVRAYNCLRNAGITELAQLKEKTERDLREIRCLGTTTLEEIKHILEKEGMKLKNERCV